MNAPITEPIAMSPTATQATSPMTTNSSAATKLTVSAKTFFKALVRANVSGNNTPSVAKQDDPLRGAEVAAVDAGEETDDRRKDPGIDVGRSPLAPRASRHTRAATREVATASGLPP